MKLASSGQSGDPSAAGSSRSAACGRGGNRGVARRERASRGRRCLGWGAWPTAGRLGASKSWRQSMGARLERGAQGSRAGPGSKGGSDWPQGGSVARPRLPGAGPSQGSRQPSSSSSSQSSLSSTQRPRPPGRGSPPARPPGCGRPLALEPGLAPATPSTSWRPVANH